MTDDQRKLIDEAARSIEAAELLESKGFWGYAASRAYFAMFYMAEALLLQKELSFSRHSAVIAAFGQHFAKTGDVPAQLHKQLIEGMELRQAGDYASDINVSPEQCMEQIRRAKAFYALVQGRLEPS